MATPNREHYIREEHLEFYDAWYLSEPQLEGASAALRVKYPELSMRQTLEVLLYWGRTYLARKKKADDATT